MLTEQIYAQKLINVYLAYLPDELLTHPDQKADSGSEKFYDKRHCLARNSSLAFASSNLRVNSTLSFLNLYTS